MIRLSSLCCWVLLHTPLLAQSYAPPAPSAFTAASQTDGSGNEWSVSQVIEDFTPAPEKNPANYSPMTLVSPAMWVGSDPDPWSHPAYKDSNKTLASGGPATGKNRIAAMTFKPAASMLYSWTGSAFCADESTNVAPTRLTFGKMSHGIWLPLYDTWVSHAASLDLRTVAALQKIPVKSDEVLTLLVRSSYHSSNVVFLNWTDPVKISIGGEVNKIPDFAGAGGNPSPHCPEGEWRVDYVTQEHPGYDNNYANYHPMIYDGGLHHGAITKWGYNPAFDSAYGLLTSAGAGGGGPGDDQQRSAITFSPYRSGRFAITGTLYCVDASNTSPIYVRFGVFKKGGTTPEFSFAHMVTAPEHTDIDLGAIPELRNIEINAGDRLAITVASSTWWSIGMMYTAFYPANPISIDRLPDVFPAKLGLTSTSGLNPNSDFSGNEWQVYQITSGTASDVPSYSSMSWSGLNNRWEGSSLTPDQHPTWLPNSLVLTSSRGPGGNGGVPAASFEPAAAGHYSWAGRLSVAYTDDDEPGNVIFGKIDSLGNYVSLKTHTFTTTDLTLDLETVSELQGVALATGDRLTISLHPGVDTANTLSMANISVKSGDMGDRSSQRTANPTVDYDGNSWEVFQVDPIDQTDIANYTPMTWDSVNRRWKGFALTVDGNPVWFQESCTLSASRDSGWGAVSALKFTAATAGNYSWTGPVGLYRANGSGGSNVVFGKFDSTNTYSLLHTEGYTTNRVFDTTTAGALQSVYLAAGESLVVSLHPGHHVSNVISLRPPEGVCGVSCNGVFNPVPGPEFPVENASANLTHLIHADAPGTSMDPRIFGVSAPHMQLGSDTFMDSAYGPGMFARGPGPTGEGTYWHLAEYSGYKFRTMLEFMELQADKDIIPLVGVATLGGFDTMGGTTVFPGSTPATYPLNTAQIDAIASYAADQVRYTNHIIQTYKQGDTISDPRDAAILARLSWGGKPILPGPGDPIPPKAIYWEIGNEPDHTVTQGQPDYNFGEIYDAVVRAMIAEDPDIKVGPALGDGTRLEDTNVVNNVLNLFGSTLASPIDFFSFHPYEGLGGYYRNLGSAMNTADEVTIHGGVLTAERALREMRATYEGRIAGLVYNAIPYVTDDIRVASGNYFDPYSVEIFAGEYDSLGAIDWSSSSGWPAGYSEPPQQTMFGALSMLETLFILHDRGYNGAAMWDVTGGDADLRVAVPIFTKIAESMPDTLIYEYAPSVDPRDVRGDNVRIYCTRNETTGRITLWGSNMYHEKPVTVNLALRGLSSTPAVTKSVLRNPDDSAQGFLNRSRNPSVGPHTYVRWNAGTFPSSTDLSDFQLELPPATITVLEIDP